MANEMLLIDLWGVNMNEVDTSDCTDVEDILSAVITYLSELPTIEAEPVVHGRWIRKGNKNECDQCGFFYFSTRADYRRCPKCEAKMDLKEV